MRRTVPIAAGFAMVLASMSLVQYASFTREKLYDLGDFDSALWNTVHGRFLWSDPYASRLTSRHLYLTLPLLAPLYAMLPRPWLLLATQALVIAATIPLLGSGASPAARAATIALFVVHPAVSNLAALDVHPDVVAIPLLVLLWRALRSGTARWSVAWTAAVVLSKEDFALTTAALAVAFLPRRASRKAALAALGTSLAWIGIAFGLWLPAASPSGGVWQLSRYARWGSGAAAVMTAPFREPGAVLAHVSDRDRLTYLARFLGPLLPALATPAGIAVLPGLFVSLMSQVKMQSSIDYWYHAPMVGVLYAGLPEALDRLGRRRPRVLRATTVALVALGGWHMVRHGQIARFGSDLAAGRLLTAHDAVVRRALALVPAGVPALLDNNVAAHASHRRIIATEVFDPAPGTVPEVVLVDAREGFLAEGWHPDHARQLREVLARMRGDPRYAPAFEEDGVALWRRR